MRVRLTGPSRSRQQVSSELLGRRAPPDSWTRPLFFIICLQIVLNAGAAAPVLGIYIVVSECSVKWDRSPESDWLGLPSSVLSELASRAHCR